jgi:hypothetical protein
MRKRPARPPVTVVTYANQTEQQRLAMVMMQLDMALAMAREKGLVEVQAYLEDALAKARSLRKSALH